MTSFGLASSMVVMFMLYQVCGARLALVALRGNVRITVTTVILPLLALIIIMLVSGVPASTVSPLLIWLVAAISAGVLGGSGNLPLAILSTLVLVVIGILLFFLSVPNPVEIWRTMLEQMFNQAGDMVISPPVESQIDMVAQLMTGAIAGAALIQVNASVLFGRWWQARLLNSDGFQREFYQLRLGRVLTVIALGLLILAEVTNSVLLVTLSVPALVVYLFQGLAVIHAFVGRQAENKWSISVFYVLLILFQQLVLLVSIMGIIDAWVDSRRRWLKAG